MPFTYDEATRNRETAIRHKRYYESPHFYDKAKVAYYDRKVKTYDKIITDLVRQAIKRGGE